AARGAIGEGGAADRGETGVAHHQRGRAVPHIRHDEGGRALVQGAKAFVSGAGHDVVLSACGAVTRRKKMRSSFRMKRSWRAKAKFACAAGSAWRRAR